MVNFSNKIPLIIFLFLFSSSIVLAAEITARVDRNPILLGESFQLFLTAKGSIDGDPDFSELQKNFSILNTSQSSRYSNINGVGSSAKTWVLVLITDEPGNFIIPAIKFGKDKSNSFTVSIVENTTSQGNKQQAQIFLEVDVEPKSVYVQQQLIYTIRIYWQGRLSNASLTELISENDQAIITRIGNDSESSRIIKGINYTVLERRFAIFPQKRGTLKLAPLTFKTQFINANVRPRSFFNLSPFGAQSAVKRIRSKAVEIQVKGIPATFTTKYPDATWLPVEKLSIMDSWSGDVKTFKSGEPMTRTINLMAQNLTTAQLPDIKFDTPKNIKSYPDVPEVKQQNNNHGITAIKQFKTALLPTKAGKFKLSKIVIPWWNTKTNRIEESILAAQKITVSSSANEEIDQNRKFNTTNKKQVTSNTTDHKNESVNANTLNENVLLSVTERFSVKVWMVVSIIFALLWLITVYLFLRLRAKFKGLEIESYEPARITPISTKLIKNACKNNDAHECCKIILQWANSKSNSERFTNLASLYPLTEPGLRQAFEKLQNYLYSKESSEWHGAELWTLFKENPPLVDTGSKSTGGHSGLASLYAHYE